MLFLFCKHYYLKCIRKHGSVRSGPVRSGPVQFAPSTPSDRDWPTSLQTQRPCPELLCICHSASPLLLPIIAVISPELYHSALGVITELQPQCKQDTFLSLSEITLTDANRQGARNSHQHADNSRNSKALLSGATADICCPSPCSM